MKRRQGWLFFIIFLLTLSVYLLINYPLQLGLDLKGGSQLTLQIIKEEGKVTKDELDAVNSVIDRRVNNLGVSESNLQTLGGDQLILELPGEQNPLVASRVLGKTALLEFRTQKEGTSTDLKNLQLQRLNIKDLIEKYSSKDKTQYDDNFLKIIQDDLDARPIRLSSQDIPTPYNGNLENLTIIQPHQIVEKVEDLISGSI